MPDKFSHADVCACRLCGESAEFSFSSLILNRYQVAYFVCRACGMMQTEHPYWLEEAYDHALAAADTGVMQRNLHLSRTAAVLFRVLRMQQASFLDYGGGHGVFTRLMRDHGFDFQCWDAHAANLFARGFEGDPEKAYRGVTAFEVLEHLLDPAAFFKQTLGSMQPDILLVGTELFSEPVNPRWHYFCFPTGQHIAFCQISTLQGLASDYGYRLISIGNLHLFIRPLLYTWKLRPAMRFAARVYPLLRFPSLVTRDHEQLLRADG